MHNAMKFTSRTNHRNKCREPKPQKGQKLHASIAMAVYLPSANNEKVTKRTRRMSP